MRRMQIQHIYRERTKVRDDWQSFTSAYTAVHLHKIPACRISHDSAGRRPPQNTQHAYAFLFPPCHHQRTASYAAEYDRQPEQNAKFAGKAEISAQIGRVAQPGSRRRGRELPDSVHAVAKAAPPAQVAGGVQQQHHHADPAEYSQISPAARADVAELVRAVTFRPLRVVV